ncbi:hypothetical protein KDH_36300 [Dictyobacter sp. S3.2.2.5]|uniref:Transporter n=1 Tax=Dictyobacter halimunensis TaxID=3026934 RepID=A0ABQ6FWA4_9CHLR|nr:hypothetical protein KDH_36300 [Dictyobacter sp. S3.2.2.5]
MNTSDQSEQYPQGDQDENKVKNVEMMPQLVSSEYKQVENRVSISPAVIHEAIRVEGEIELNRTIFALACSSLAAGLSMGFSLIGRGVIHYYLPTTAFWRPLVDNFGYSLGFLIVILGRQQLFTENTLTVILPLLTHFDKRTTLRVLRLWGIVLLGNFVGAFLLATLVAQTLLFPPGIRDVFTQLSQQAFEGGFGLLLLRGIFAGWLIALMVWLLPASENMRLHIIVFVTYIIGVAAFAHVIVDAVSAFYLVSLGKVSFWYALGAYLLPILLGNIIGGVTLVAVLNYGQVATEASKKEKGEQKEDKQ